jgi:hypothetical protein
MLKRATSLLMAVGLALAGMPVGAQALPDSISGAVPGGVEGVANAVLQDASERSLSMVPVTNGAFIFRSVAPGEYYVALFSASGQRVARSCSVVLATGTRKEISFDCPLPAAPAAAPTAAASVAAPGGGMGTTGWVLIGAAAVGITTAVVVATDEDDGAASPSR